MEGDGKRGLDFSLSALPAPQKRAKGPADPSNAVEVAGRNASEALSQKLQQLQSETSINSPVAIAVQELENALALQQQVDSVVLTLQEHANAIVQKATSNLRLAREAKTCLRHKDIWINNIFPFVGMGQFAFVAPVSHGMKDLYETYCGSVLNPPKVIFWNINGGRRAATYSNSFHSAAVSSVPRAEYWYTHRRTGTGYHIHDYAVCSAAAIAGNIHVLEWALNKGFDWDTDTCKNAALNGHIDILKYAHQNGFPWKRNTCGSAASGGQLECLKYAHENECRWDIRTTQSAAENGHLECLKYAHENGCPWGNLTCYLAAYNGRLEVLKYAHEHGCPWDKATTQSAAKNGHLECLKYAHENGCPWAENSCHDAAENGHLDVLKYAHENGCPLDKRTCTDAASNGHLDCLKYAHENGCDWAENTCRSAAASGHLECLKYAHEHGCPWDEHT